jgi:ribonuclease M5
MNKIKIDIPIIVEGKYDLIKLQSIIDGHIIKTDGFSLFKSQENKKYIKKIAEKNGIIILTDSDGAGLVIRNYLSSILPKDKIFHIYPPQIVGKEKRKTAPSKEGYLGVEGISADVLRKLFEPFVQDTVRKNKRMITKLDFFEDGLTGCSNSVEKRSALLKKLDLPQNISANALLDTLNFLYSYEEYKKFINEGEDKK